MPDMTVQLTDMAGQPLQEKEGKPLTLGRACILALDTSLLQDREEDLLKKLTRGKLAEDIFDAMTEGKDLQLSAENTALLKERIGKTFTAASVVRKICKLIDPATE